MLAPDDVFLKNCQQRSDPVGFEAHLPCRRENGNGRRGSLTRGVIPDGNSCKGAGNLSPREDPATVLVWFLHGCHVLGVRNNQMWLAEIPSSLLAVLFLMFRLLTGDVVCSLPQNLGRRSEQVANDPHVSTRLSFIFVVGRPRHGWTQTKHI